MTAANAGTTCREDNDVAAVTVLVELVAGTISVARALVAGQRQVDLGGLDADMGLLCARVLGLPSHSGRALRPRLAALVAELDALEAALVSPMTGNGAARCR